MTVNYTTNLSLGQPVTGTESGTWGDDVNNAVTSYLDIAIAGGLAVTVTTADVTLTITQGTSVATNIGSTTAQYAILNVSGAMTAARNLILPSSSRQYVINNACTGGFLLTVKGSATTGVTLVNGEKAHVFWNGTDYSKVSNSSGAGVFSSITNTGLTSGRVVYSTTGGLETDSANLTFDGTNLTLLGGTANGVTYLNGSKVLTSGSALTFDGTNFATTGTASAAKLIPTGSSATGNGLYLPAANSVGLSTNGTNAVYIDSSQNVGIGTTSPVNRLHVAGSATTQLQVQMSGQADMRIISDTGYGALSVESNMPLLFRTNATERMRIDASGNVGIGTSSPGAKLDVAGTAYAANQTGGLRLNNTSAVANNYFDVLFGLDSVGIPYGALKTGNDGNAYLTFFTGAGPTERMRIDSAGNLGLGVIPSAWFTSRKAISIYNGASFVGVSDGGAEIWGNSYLNSAGNSIYAISAAAALYQVNRGANGSHAWFTAPSGTAGNAISFTQAMTLDASGNLLVGTTASGYGKLTVVNPTGVSAFFSNSTYLDQYLKFTEGTGYTIEANYGLNFNVNTLNAAYPMKFSMGGTERARIDSSGNLLVGVTSSPGSPNAQIVAGGTTDAGIQLASTNGGGGLILAPGGAGTAFYTYTGAVGSETYTERARIDPNGNLLVGRTSSIGGARVSAETITGTPTYAAYLPTTGTETAFLFVNSNGTVGSITTNGSATLYNVTSDQRLKENIVDAPEFGSVIDSLQVRSFDWKTDETHQRAGFIAQELVTVAPEAVHQPVNEEEMMAVDYSKLVPMLVKEIQSLRQRLSAANL